MIKKMKIHQIFGPLYVTYDDIVTFVNRSSLKSDNSLIGLSIQPRVLLNYFLGFSKIDFDESDKEFLGIAILRYTVRLKKGKHYTRRICKDYIN